MMQRKESVSDTATALFEGQKNYHFPFNVNVWAPKKGFVLHAGESVITDLLHDGII